MGGGARRGRAASVKREQGLKKKASELATLCGVDVCLLGVDPDGNLFFWPDDVSELRRIARRYLDAVGGAEDREAPAGQKKRKKAPTGGSGLLRSAPPRKRQETASQASAAREIYQVQEQGEAGGNVGEDLLHLMSSPSRELLCDLEPLLLTVDGGGNFPIHGDVFQPRPVTAVPSEKAYAPPAAWMHEGGPLETAEDGGDDPYPAFPASSPPADPPVLVPGTTDFGFYGADPLGMAAEFGFHDGVAGMPQLPCFVASYHSLDPHFIMY